MPENELSKTPKNRQKIKQFCIQIIFVANFLSSILHRTTRGTVLGPQIAVTS